MLKDCGFSFAYDVNIPGMPSTREQDYAQNMTSTDNQCPQGICITEDYYMITAYNTDDSESLGALYIFDKETGEYMVTLGMKRTAILEDLPAMEEMSGSAIRTRGLWSGLVTVI